MAEIPVCPNHRSYTVPMISTLAFKGAELWCPYCGHIAGAPFGDYERARPTQALLRRRRIYRRRSREFLRAIGTAHAAGVQWPRGSGEYIRPADLPKAEKDRLERIRRRGWRRLLRAELSIRQQVNTDG